MVVFLLNFKASLENVESIEFDVANLVWQLDISDPTGDDTKKGITVSPHDRIGMEGSRAEFNFVMRWPGTRKQCTLNITELKKVTHPVYTDADCQANIFKAIVGFDSRGINLDNCYSPSDGINVVTSSGKRFENIDLSTKEWCEFDDKGQQAVTIQDVEWKFTVHRSAKFQ